MIKKLFIILLIITLNTFSATNVYYSVGQDTLDHKTGTPTLTIVNGIGTFSVAQESSNMGVGDKVVYDGNIAFISGKINKTQWTLINRIGATPENVSGVSVLKISHCFQYLKNAIGGETPAIINNDHLGTSDLTSGANGYILNIPLYYDNKFDTVRLTTSNTIWITTDSQYINIYTPYDTSTQCNNSQRHSGVWNPNKHAFVLTTISDYNRGFYIRVKDVRLDGIQIRMNSTHNNCDMLQLGAESAKYYISNCILDGNFSGSGSSDGIDGYDLISTTTTIAYNNIIYGITNGTGIKLRGVAYNNTVVNCLTGYKASSTSTVINNISQNCTDGFSGMFSEASVNNISDLEDDAPIGGYTADIIFENALNNNYHLNELDISAINTGSNLSADLIMPFNNDIDGEIRGTNWDIGADEFNETQNLNCDSNLTPLDTSHVGATQLILYDTLICDTGDVVFQTTQDTLSTITNIDTFTNINATYIMIDTVSDLTPSQDYFFRSVFTQDTGLNLKDTTSWFMVTMKDTGDTSDPWYVPPEFTITLNTVGSGTVAQNPSGSTHDSGTVIRFTATPAEGWSFTGYTDSLVSSDSIDSIVLNSNKIVTATFTEDVPSEVPTITSVSPSSPRLFKTFEATGTNLLNCKLYLNSVSLGTPASATSTSISDTALGTTRGFHWLIAEDTLTGMRCSTSSRIYIKNTQLDTVLLGRP